VRNHQVALREWFIAIAARLRLPHPACCSALTVPGIVSPITIVTAGWEGSLSNKLRSLLP